MTHRSECWQIQQQQNEEKKANTNKVNKHNEASGNDVNTSKLARSRLRCYVDGIAALL